MPKKVEVIALSCQKCRQIEVVATAAIEESGADAEVTKIQDSEEMRKRGVERQPALFIDGELISEGRLPTVEEIKALLTQGKIKTEDQVRQRSE
ncbi:MAG TPA: thioredoxin family protein [Methanomassiliicoccales archaeon]|nr:thioredoxin family protein [Methanomassiliicoccales archaeon]